MSSSEPLEALDVEPGEREEDEGQSDVGEVLHVSAQNAATAPSSTSSWMPPSRRRPRPRPVFHWAEAWMTLRQTAGPIATPVGSEPCTTSVDVPRPMER